MATEERRILIFLQIIAGRDKNVWNGEQWAQSPPSLIRDQGLILRRMLLGMQDRARAVEVNGLNARTIAMYNASNWVACVRWSIMRQIAGTWLGRIRRMGGCVACNAAIRLREDAASSPLENGGRENIFVYYFPEDSARRRVKVACAFE